jgi:hypothetical protein
VHRVLSGVVETVTCAAVGSPVVPGKGILLEHCRCEREERRERERALRVRCEGMEVIQWDDRCRCQLYLGDNQPTSRNVEAGR